MFSYSRLLCRILLFLDFCKAIFGENILLFPHFGSHFHVMAILAEELHSRGHNITMVAPRVCVNGRNFPYKVLTYDISESDLQSHLQAVLPTFIQDPLKALPSPDIARVLKEGFLSDYESIQDSLKSTEFHLAVVDTSVSDALVFVTKLNLSYIMLSCFKPDLNVLRNTDFSLSLSYIPDGHHHYKFTNRMTFLERAVIFFHYWSKQAHKKLFSMQMGKHLIKMYLPEMMGISGQASMRNAHLWIINSGLNIEFPYPVMPNVKFVGSLSARQPIPLSKELGRFVNDSGEAGIILVSFSTLLPSIDPDFSNKFLDAFSGLPQKVVWRRKDISDNPDKFLFQDWIPQNDMLGCGKTRVVVTNGGLNGIQEAMYHGVPLIILPIFGDQPALATQVEARGYGVRLNPFNLTSSSILTALETVLHNDRFKTKMESVSEMVKYEHSRGSGREMAAFWVEHALKYRQNYITPTAKYLSYIQCHCLDVIAVSIFLPLMIMFIIVKTVQRRLRRKPVN